jgi:poly-gamma-glutamate synthesis protein (capsule biosynthesis protein)
LLGVTFFLCGDVMPGRGIDQILPHPVDPRIFETVVADARDQVALAERASGAVARPVEPDYVWGEALAELARVAPDARIVNLETAVTTSERPRPKGINYRMHPENIACLTVAGIDCYAGAGRSLAAARAPAVIPVSGGGRVQVFGLGSASSGIGRDWGAAEGRPGVHLLADLSMRTVRDIGAGVAQVKQPGDIAVASIHWAATGDSRSRPTTRPSRGR